MFNAWKRRCLQTLIQVALIVDLNYLKAAKVVDKLMDLLESNRMPPNDKSDLRHVLGLEDTTRAISVTAS